MKGPAAPRISEAMVRGLLAAQHPDLAVLPLSRADDHGWDNAVYRLGDELAVRLPRRPEAAVLIEHELAWLPVLAPRLPLPVPAVVRRGTPGHGYPWGWSVNRWVAGEPVGTRAVPGAGAALAGFLAALHRPAPADAPRNPVRGIPLADRLPLAEQHADLAAFRSTARAPARPDPQAAQAALAAFRRAARAPAHPGPGLWCHGDLHTGNVLADARGITGVIDFGDLTAGDPAVDLAVAWMLPRRERAPLHAYAQRLDPAAWQRGRGWALAMALAVLAHGPQDGLLPRIAAAALIAATEDGP